MKKYEEICKELSKIKLFINKYNWKEIITHQKMITGNVLKKIILKLPSMCYMLKKWIYISCLYFKTQFRSWKTNHSFMIPNGEGWRYLAIKKNICIIKRNNIKILLKIAFIFSEEKTNLNLIKKYVKIKIL